MDTRVVSISFILFCNTTIKVCFTERQFGLSVVLLLSANGSHFLCKHLNNRAEQSKQQTTGRCVSYELLNHMANWNWCFTKIKRVSCLICPRPTPQQNQDKTELYKLCIFRGLKCIFKPVTHELWPDVQKVPSAVQSAENQKVDSVSWSSKCILWEL